MTVEDFVGLVVREWTKDAAGWGLTAILSAVSIILGVFVRSIWGWIRHCVRYVFTIERAKKAVARVKTPAGPAEGPGLWLTTPIIPPSWYTQQLVSNAKVVCIANLKGGVGKTTLAANIGASLAVRRPDLNIKLVDLDFQGSLSSMAFPDNRHIPTNSRSSLVSRLISGDCDNNLLQDLGREVGSHSNLRVFTAYYDLAAAENRLMIEWLLSDRSRDLRFRLVELFLSNEAFDPNTVVIIDCPPRLTTAAVQAFCCASKILIPTILDRTSSSAVDSFVTQIRLLKAQGVCPHIDIAGVLPTITGNPPTVAQGRARARLRDELSVLGIPFWEDDELKLEIPKRAALQNAPGIGYLSLGAADLELKARIDTVADKLVFGGI